MGSLHSRVVRTIHYERFDNFKQLTIEEKVGFLGKKRVEDFQKEKKGKEKWEACYCFIISKIIIHFINITLNTVNEETLATLYLVNIRIQFLKKTFRK